ncbi:hypothetical protein HY988_06000 [Candidatus Micrarchaeota archaeon]|nr:hypothetical protein [Candidatus Micrarchaeota archaeon]
MRHSTGTGSKSSRVSPSCAIQHPGPAIIPALADKLLGSAMTLMHERDYMGAVNVLELLLTERPYHPPALCLLIKAAQRADCFEVAECRVQAFEDRYSEPNQQICAHLIDAYARMGSSEKAEEVFQFAGGSAKASVHCVAARIRSFGELDEIGRAFGLFRSANKRNLRPDVIYPALIFALEYASKSDPSCQRHLQEAHRTFGKAVLLGIEHPAMYESLMRMYCTKEMFGEARDILDDAVVADVARDKTCTTLISALYNAGRYSEMIEVIDSLPNLLRNLNEIQFQNAEALRKTRAYAEARGVLREIERKGVTEEESYRLKVMDICVIDSSGDHMRAFNRFQRLLETMPKNSRHLPRAVCGYVFCWQRNDCVLELINRDEANSLFRKLQIWNEQYSNNLKRDIDHAIGILRRAYPHLEGGLELIA